MAVAFMNLVKKEINAEFIFAVDPVYMTLEQEWAERYGVEVVGRDTIITGFLNFPPVIAIRRLKHSLQGRKPENVKDADFWRSVHEKYQEQFNKSDCVINMNGIAFVGDGTRPWETSLTERTSSTYAGKYNKPFFRFIQSYGPFKDWRVKLLAGMEFRKLPCVMARGNMTAEWCREVAGNVPVYAFPDEGSEKIKSKYSIEYLKKMGLTQGEYIVLSPSAVIANMPDRSDKSFGSKHAETYAKIAKNYLNENKTLLFLPHMTSPTPSQCDKAVCNKVIKVLEREGIDTSRCHVINDELDCTEMKALIYYGQALKLPNAFMKYQDLLDFYKASEFAVDARSGGPSVVFEKVIQRAAEWSDSRIKLVKDTQPELEDMVEEAGKICREWILDVTG